MVNEPQPPAETHKTDESLDVPGAAPGKTLSPEAERALKEAQARREETRDDQTPKEINGPSGEEPTRYGDWERKGIAVDF